MVDIYDASKPKEDTLLANEVVGVKVITHDGDEIGTVKSVHISDETMMVEGITLSKGLFKEQDYVGRQYILSMSNKGVVLSITPISEYIGKEVYDSDGQKVGKVREIYRVTKTNNILSLTVDRGFGKDDLIVMDSMIDKIGRNIILNKPVEA